MFVTSHGKSRLYQLESAFVLYLYYWMLLRGVSQFVSQKRALRCFV